MHSENKPGSGSNTPPRELGDGDDNKQKPWLPLHHEIIQLWQELLNTKSIGIHDTFYELGGDSHLAVEMLLSLEATFQKTIPIGVLANLTVEQIADQLRSSEEAEQPVILKFNENGTRPPLFYLHGDVLGGGFYCRKLADCLGESQPLYAIPPTEVQNASDSPSIEEMVAAHLRVLGGKGLDRPYALGGFCDGGLIAYEMARQLTVTGKGPGALLLVDTIVPRKALQRARKVIQIIGSVSGMSQDERIRMLPKTWDRLERFLRWVSRKNPDRLALAGNYMRLFPKKIFRRQAGTSEAGKPSTREVDGMPARRREIPHAYLWATAGYKARPYSGSLDLLMAEHSEDERRDETWGWKSLAGNIRVQMIPGGHLEAVTTHADVLAEKMSLCLREMNGSHR